MFVVIKFQGFRAVLHDAHYPVFHADERFNRDIDRKTGFGAYFLAINRGKKSLTLELKSEQGRDVALRLARDCDIVVHNFRPGVMERLGLGYAAFKAANPQVIYAGASAFGSKGPLGDKPGNDFALMLKEQLEHVTKMQNEADDGVKRILTGEADNLSEVFSAAKRAQIAFDLLMEIRNKLVDSYTELRQMRVS